MSNGVITRRLCRECEERPVMLGRTGDWSDYCSRTCKRRARSRRRAQARKAVS